MSFAKSVSNHKNHKRSYANKKKIDEIPEIIKCPDCDDLEDQLVQKINQQSQIRKENDKLRNNLKKLNAELDVHLHQIQKYKINKDKDGVSDNKKVLEKELLNVQNMTKKYKKQEEKLRLLADPENISKNFVEAQNRQLEAKREIQKLKEDQNNLKENIKKQRRILEDVSDLNEIRNQIQREKIFIKEQEVIQSVNEENFKGQKSKIDQLEQIHKQVCEKFKHTFQLPEVNKEEFLRKQKKPQQKTQQETHTSGIMRKSKSIISMKTPYSVRNVNKNDEVLEEKFIQQQLQSGSALSSKQFHSFDKKIEFLSVSNKVVKKVSNEQQKKLNLQLEELETKNNMIDDLIGTKAQEISDCQTKIQELNQLSQINNSINVEKSLNASILNESEIFSQNQNNGSQLHGKQFKQRKLKGGIIDKKDQKQEFNNFDQQEPKLDIQRIFEINVQYIDEFILSFDVTYLLKNGKFQKVQNINQDLDYLTIQEPKNLNLKLRGKEQIQYITGYYSNESIYYLKIMTSIGNYLFAGNEKIVKNEQKFTFTATKDEIPIAFFGQAAPISLRLKNRELRNKLCLTEIGLILVNKEEYYQKQTIQGNKNNKGNLYGAQIEEDDSDLEATKKEEIEQKQEDGADDNQQENIEEQEKTKQQQKGSKKQDNNQAKQQQQQKNTKSDPKQQPQQQSQSKSPEKNQKNNKNSKEKLPDKDQTKKEENTKLKGATENSNKNINKKGAPEAKTDEKNKNQIQDNGKGKTANKKQSDSPEKKGAKQQEQQKQEQKPATKNQPSKSPAPKTQEATKNKQQPAPSNNNKKSKK